jgi:fucose permease
LIRSVKDGFAQSDAGIGLFYFLYAVVYAAGSLGGGLLTERVGRRTVLSLGAVLHGVGLIALGVSPSWPVFLLAALPAGLGVGVIDGGGNGLFLDLFKTERGRALNLLHLCFSLGALTAPLVVGRLVEGGTAWQSILVATGAVAIVVGILFAVVAMPSGRHHGTAAADTDVPAVATGGRRRLPTPLLLLALAIACYVASEVGVSNWLVRFLETASIGLATSALALFWGCLALGRIVTAWLGDRFDHARFAATAALIAAIALVAAAVVPSLPASIILFGLVGFAFGPIYPLIMAVGGDLYPSRSAAVSGFLSGCAVIGAIVYPPLMGFISVQAGLSVAMIGAAILAFSCAAVLFALGRRESAFEGAGEPA